MGLLYISEHTSCHNYAKDFESGFILKEAPIGSIIHNGRASTNLIIFVIHGQLSCSCDGFKEIIIGDCEMVFILRSSFFKCSAELNSKYLVCFCDKVTHLCDKNSISSLYKFTLEHDYQFKSLDIRGKMKVFLQLLTLYLEDGANCIHLHDIKVQELFWLLRAYYTKQELASFLYPIIGETLDFRTKVYANYQRAGTAQELARMCGLSTRVFGRKFKVEFGESPYSWMQKKMISHIKNRLSDKSIPLKDIIEEFNLSSLPHLVRLCKSLLGETPGEFRKRINN